jgi:hypothetical protein
VLVGLLDPLTLGNALDLGVCNSRVFRDLAKKILAVYRLQSPAEQAIERKATLRELNLLRVCYPPNDIFRRASVGRAETFGDTI